jgi:ribosomal protein S18 acetylase RimI-like enzyme
LRAQLAADDARLWVGEHHLTIVGYCLVRLSQRPPVFEDRSYAEILDLAVEEPYRRCGLGTALVTEAQGWVESRGIRRVELRVSAYNEGGLAFWRKLGYQSYLEVMYRDDPQRSG